MADEPSVYWDYAFSVINALTGNRVLYPAAGTIVEEHTVSPHRLCGGSTVHPRLCNCGTCCASLLIRPAKNVTSVTRDDEPVTWEMYNSYTVKVCDNLRPDKCGDAIYIVEYTPQDLPANVRRAVDLLAAQLEAAATGGDCVLPERVTSVSRQGMSWTLLDPQDFFEKGRTGIYEVDLLISTINPSRAKRRARVFSPESPPGQSRRLGV